MFNATYQQQAEVDARLTNGADVTVTESPGAQRRARGAPRGSRASPGVRSVEPLQHRFAYVGADLQDLYGVRPATIGARRQAAGRLVPGRHAPRSSCSALAPQPDGVLVSAETVHDFQLQPGRPAPPAPAGRPHQAVQDRPVPLRRRRQGVPDRADGLVLRRQRRATSRRRPAATPSARSSSRPTAPSPATVAAARPRAASAPSAQVTDIVDQRQVVGSNLTAVELSGLTQVELGFALVLAVAASGLALGLGFQRAPAHVRHRRARSARAAASSAASCGASRCS